MLAVFAAFCGRKRQNYFARSRDLCAPFTVFLKYRFRTQNALYFPHFTYCVLFAAVRNACARDVTARRVRDEMHCAAGNGGAWSDDPRRVEISMGATRCLKTARSHVAGRLPTLPMNDA